MLADYLPRKFRLGPARASRSRSISLTIADISVTSTALALQNVSGILELYCTIEKEKLTNPCILALVVL
jgi:hypothetical protein